MEPTTEAQAEFRNRIGDPLDDSMFSEPLECCQRLCEQVKLLKDWNRDGKIPTVGMRAFMRNLLNDAEDKVLVLVDALLAE